MSDLANIKVVHQIWHTTDIMASREVNAYLDYGWTLLSVLQWSSPEDGQTARPVFVVGHSDAKAKRPTQDPYSKRWE